MKKIALLFVFLICLSTLPIDTSQATEPVDNFTVTGKVLNQSGEIAGSTSIKIAGYNSVWTDSEGNYQYTGIASGEHSIRAYFMNDGHTVAYRKIILDSDLQLDWVVDHNWITVNSDDQLATFSVSGENIQENKPHSELLEFGPYEMNQYYNVTAFYDNGLNQTAMLKLQGGSAGEPFVNHLVMNQGTTSKYGYLSDMLGNSMSNIDVHIGQHMATTNSDGFYLINGLIIGETVNLSVYQNEIEIIATHQIMIEDSLGWYNLTSEITPEMPIAPEFLTSSFDIQIDDDNPKLIEWTKGDYTDYFELYLDSEVIYRGASTQFEFTPSEVGSFEISLKAINSNGSISATKKISAVVLSPSEDSFWNVGMSWQYAVDYLPESTNGTHELTMTAIGTEVIQDTFGVEQECYLLRVEDIYDTPDRIRYYWIDSVNLLRLKTYSETSDYFVAGSMGWNFTTENGAETSLFSGNSVNAHFNRTNIIGVPGHPNGYDDTNNIIQVTENVTVTTPSGSYLTTYFKITDLNDNIDSWELWYNETVRNWVKIIDRLPGSHSEAVTYHLINHSGVPTIPQFVTQSGITNLQNLQLEWGEFGRAMSYTLLENDIEVYQGNELSYEMMNKEDGIYQYQLKVVLPSGSELLSEFVTIEVAYIIQPPILNMPYTQNITDNNELLVSWTPIDNVDWYSMLHTGQDGLMTEVYNGSDTSFVFDLDEGQNRFRVKAGITDGKYSEPSNSSYVNYDPEESDKDNFLTFLPLFGILSTITMAAIFFQNRRSVS